jgi:hypothetical protein
MSAGILLAHLLEIRHLLIPQKFKKAVQEALSEIKFKLSL